MISTNRRKILISTVDVTIVRPPRRGRRALSVATAGARRRGRRAEGGGGARRGGGAPPGRGRRRARGRGRGGREGERRRAGGGAAPARGARARGDGARRRRQGPRRGGPGRRRDRAGPRPRRDDDGRRAAATLLRGAAANVAAVGAEDAAAEARAATVDMPAPPPTAGEWRAACDAAVVSHYDFGVRATAAARRAQFTAQEPEDIFEGLAEDDMGARFSAVVVQASKKFAAEFPPLAKRTVATTLRVPRRPLGCCTKRRRASFRGGPRPTAPRLF